MGKIGGLRVGRDTDNSTSLSVTSCSGEIIFYRRRQYGYSSTQHHQKFFYTKVRHYRPGYSSIRDPQLSEVAEVRAEIFERLSSGKR